MVGIPHRRCRKALLDGDVSLGIRAHVAACEECRCFAAGLRRIDAAVPVLAPPPAPAGLEARVIARVQTACAAGSPDITLPDTATPGGTMNPAPTVRFAMTRVLAAAAAAILVVGSLAVAAPRGHDDETLDTLLTAASEATSEVGSAHVSVEGRATTKVRLTNLDEFLKQVPSIDEMLAQMPEIPEVPDLPETPAPPSAKGGGAEFQVPELPELPEPSCESISEDECAALKEAHRQATEELRKAVEQAGSTLAGSGVSDGSGIPGLDRDAIRSQLDAQLQQGRAQMEEQLRAAQAEFEQKLQEIPREFTCTYTFSGSGPMAIPGRAEIGGEGDVSCEPETVDAQGSFHVVIDQDVSFSDNGNGTFTRSSGGPGDIGSLVAKAEDISKLLESAQATPADHGNETIDGVEVRHLSFSADAPGGEGTAQVDVWIGVKDNIVRKAVMRTSGKTTKDGVEVEWTAEQTILVTDVNVPVDIQVPSADQIVPAPPAVDSFNGLTNPFGGSLPAMEFPGAGVGAS